MLEETVENTEETEQVVNSEPTKNTNEFIENMDNIGKEETTEIPIDKAVVLTNDEDAVLNVDINNIKEIQVNHEKKHNKEI